MISLESLPIHILLSIYSYLPIKDQVNLSTTSSHFYHFTQQFLFHTIVIVPSNYQALDLVLDYSYKFKGQFLLIKSSPANFKLLCQKDSNIKILWIFDNVNGLITNWNDPVFYKLAKHQPIQHLFSLRDIGKYVTRVDNLQTLELNFVHRDSIKISDNIIEFSSLKILKKIKNLILFTNNFDRLHKFEEIIANSIHGNGATRLKLDKLIVKTYGGIGSKQENFMFIGSVDILRKDFKMLNFNRIIDLSHLKHLELQILHQDMEEHQYWRYHVFKFFFSFFNDYRLMKQNHQQEINSIFNKAMMKKFLSDDDLEEWLYINFQRDRPYQIIFPYLTTFCVSAQTGSDFLIPQHLIRCFTLKTKSIKNLALCFDNSYWENSIRESSAARGSSLAEFYRQIIPRLTQLRDDQFVQNLIKPHTALAHKYRSKFEKIYKDCTGIPIINYDPLLIFCLLARSFNKMYIQTQLITTISAFPDLTIEPPLISQNLSEEGEYKHEAYIRNLTSKQQKSILLQFGNELYDHLASSESQIINPFELKENQYIQINNLTLHIVNNEPVWDI